MHGLYTLIVHALYTRLGRRVVSGCWPRCRRSTVRCGRRSVQSARKALDQCGRSSRTGHVTSPGSCRTVRRHGVARTNSSTEPSTDHRRHRRHWTAGRILSATHTPHWSSTNCRKRLGYSPPGLAVLAPIVNSERRILSTTHTPDHQLTIETVN